MPAPSFPGDSLTLAQAARVIPGRPHVATVYRWVRSGTRGVLLESFVRGGRRFTTPAAIENFIRATTAASAGGSPQRPRVAGGAK